jgi:tetratricopeptide (TPR) repeat protein
VAAGRKVPSLAKDSKDRRGESPIHFDLAELSLDDIRQYFDESGLLPPAEPYIEPVHRLTKGSGQPLLVALACKALAKGLLKLDQVADITPEKFEESLVIEPLLIETSENRVILEMAHVYYGFDISTLSHLYSLNDLGTSSYEAFLNRLIDLRLPYVKHFSEAQAVRLHDYFRDRLLVTWWAINDIDLGTRAAISGKLVPWYKDRIEALKAEGESPKLDTLRLQWLYHLLFADRQRAYGELWDLLDRSWHLFKYDYMYELLAMAQEVNTILKSVGQFDLALDRLEKSARAWMDLETWQTDEALALAEDVVANPAGVKRLYLTSLVAKGTALGRRGKYKEGIAILREAYQGYEELLALAQAAESGNEEAKKKLASECGIATVHGIRPERYLVLNTIGVFLRRSGPFDEAEKEFQRSLDLSQKEGDIPWMASAATQLGTILRYRGDMPGAYCCGPNCLDKTRPESADGNAAG